MAVDTLQGAPTFDPEAFYNLLLDAQSTPAKIADRLRQMSEADLEAFKEYAAARLKVVADDKARFQVESANLRTANSIMREVQAVELEGKTPFDAERFWNALEDRATTKEQAEELVLELSPGIAKFGPGEKLYVHQYIAEHRKEISARAIDRYSEWFLYPPSPEIQEWREQHGRR